MKTKATLITSHYHTALNLKNHFEIIVQPILFIFLIKTFDIHL